MNEWPAIDLAATGQNIEKLRQTTGLTVRELQNIFGFSSPQAIYKWQRGESMPTIDNLIILSAVFNVEIGKIIIYSK